jgi:hypothetical protein
MQSPSRNSILSIKKQNKGEKTCEPERQETLLLATRDLNAFVAFQNTQQRIDTILKQKQKMRTCVVKRFLVCLLTAVTVTNDKSDAARTTACDRLTFLSAMPKHRIVATQDEIRLGGQFHVRTGGVGEAWNQECGKAIFCFATLFGIVCRVTTHEKKKNKKKVKVAG